MASTLVMKAADDRLNFRWLVRLRWGAVAGQLATVFWVAYVMKFQLDANPLVALIAFAFLSNVGAWLYLRSEGAVTASLLVMVLLLDVALLTGLLYFSGGPYNPFSFLYLVYIALAAVILPARWTWLLVFVAAFAFGLLFFQHKSLMSHSMSAEHGHLDTHVQGMWFAFLVAALFIAYFIQRVHGALRSQEKELIRVREQNAKNDKLASLATLATGAAHELSTPLSTIAVAAKELERDLRAKSSPQTESDLSLIRQSVRQCRAILERMATDVGQGVGEGFKHTNIKEVVDLALSEFDPKDGKRITVSVNAQSITTQQSAVAVALRALVKNALDATKDDSMIRISSATTADAVRIQVCDCGEGMPQEVRARAIEPFFSTKSPGKGMGLGLFLAHAITERLGGAISIESEEHQGTTVTLALPVNSPS